MIGSLERDEIPTLLSDRQQTGKALGLSRCTRCGSEWSALEWHCGSPQGCHQIMPNKLHVVEGHRDEQGRCRK